MHVLHGSNVLRPQDSWKMVPDNVAAPFVPKIVDKLNALVPLQSSTLPTLLLRLFFTPEIICFSFFKDQN